MMILLKIKNLPIANSDVLANIIGEYRKYVETVDPNDNNERGKYIYRTIK